VAVIAGAMLPWRCGARPFRTGVLAPSGRQAVLRRLQRVSIPATATALAHVARATPRAHPLASPPRAFARAPSPAGSTPVDVRHGCFEQRQRSSTLACFLSAVSNAARLVARIARSVARALELAWLFGPLALTSWVLFLPGAAVAHTDASCSRTLSTRLALGWWQSLRRAVEASGPCTIKLAQWASSRPDLFSERVTRLFAPVVDSVSVHSTAATERVLRREFGPRWAESIALAPGAPLGSGCIAQVHRATLLDAAGAVCGGEPCKAGPIDVALKVMHPGAAALIELDLDLLELCARLASVLPGAAVLDPIGVAAEFASAMRAQLDLSVEAANLDEFAANFAHEPRIRFPRPLWPWVGREVLVEELMLGTPVLHSVGSPHAALIARIGLEAVLKMLFLDNCVHGDLHPGNILVLDRPAARGGGPPLLPSDVALAFVDAGIVKRVPPGAFHAVVGVLGAMVHYDGRLAGELLLAHSQGEAARPGEERDAFCAGVDAIVEHAKRPDVAFFDHIGEYVGTILHLAWRHNVKLEPDFVAVAVAVRVVEGIAHQLDPSVQVAPLCRPYYRRALLEHGFSRLPSFLAPVDESARAQR